MHVKNRILGFILDSLLTPPDNVFMHIYPVIQSTDRSTFKKHFQLFWKQFAVSGIKPQPSSTICQQKSPDLISPARLFTCISLYLLLDTYAQVFLISFLFLMYCSYSEVSQFHFFLFIKLSPNSMQLSQTK